MLPTARRRRLNMGRRGRKMICLTSLNFVLNMLSVLKLGTCNSRQVERFHLMICHVYCRLPAVTRCLKTSYRATIQVFYNEDVTFHELSFEIYYFINPSSFNSVYHRCLHPQSTEAITQQHLQSNPPPLHALLCKYPLIYAGGESERCFLLLISNS